MVIRKLLVILIGCFLYMMTSCSSTSTSTPDTSRDSGWVYFTELTSVPTPDSCVDGITYGSTFTTDEGNTVYVYYVGDDSNPADDQYEKYYDILENVCDFDFIQTPGDTAGKTAIKKGAIAREDDENLFGMALGETKKGVIFMEVMFFTKKSVASSGSSGSQNNQSSQSNQSSRSSQSTHSASLGEQQALKKAGEYLDYTAFSYDGLIDQLEYEGFSHSEAVYAADNCGANWNEQAARKAREYLDYTSFSRDGLISQLEYEGFTHSQAEYGVKAVGY